MDWNVLKSIPVFKFSFLEGKSISGNLISGWATNSEEVPETKSTCSEYRLPGIGTFRYIARTSTRSTLIRYCSLGFQRTLHPLSLSTSYCTATVLVPLDIPLLPKMKTMEWSAANYEVDLQLDASWCKCLHRISAVPLWVCNSVIGVPL